MVSLKVQIHIFGTWWTTRFIEIRKPLYIKQICFLLVYDHKYVLSIWMFGDHKYYSQFPKLNINKSGKYFINSILNMSIFLELYYIRQMQVLLSEEKKSSFNFSHLKSSLFEKVLTCLTKTFILSPYPGLRCSLREILWFCFFLILKLFSSGAFFCVLSLNNSSLLLRS